MNNGGIARMIGASFGLVFVLANAGAAGTPWDLVLRVAGVIAFGFAVVAAFRGRALRLQPRPSAIRVYWLCVVLEVVAMVVAFRVLAANDLQEYSVVAVALAVGVHFLPFGWAWRARSFIFVGLAMTLCGLVGVLLGVAGAGSSPAVLVAGVGSGAVLLAFAAVPGRSLAREQTSTPASLG